MASSFESARRESARSSAGNRPSFESGGTGRRFGKAVKARLGQIIPPLAWGALFLLAWERLVIWRNIKPFLLPAPSSIWRQLRVNSDQIIQTSKATGSNALTGLLIGAVLAVLIAFAAQRFSVIGGLLAPIAAAVNTMPIVALGPVFYNLFGSTSDTARRVVVALVAFFPIFVNTLKGLTQVEPVHEELMRSYAASGSMFLRLVRIPNALPFLLTGLRIGASLSVIAAVVVEYFGGLQNGLGNRVSSAVNNSANAKAWAYICGACLLGLAFYVSALILERLAMPWQAKRKASQSA
jgi:NitT/TauT family transport system permease protein